MTGNNARVITEADRRLFHALAEMRVMDRVQASEITGRKEVSVSTANARLLKLTRAGLLKRFFIATEEGGLKALYALTPASAAAIGVPYRPLQRKSDSVLTSDPFVLHQLAINSIYVQVKYRPAPVMEVHFVGWLSFSEVLCNAIPLIPDGYFELGVPAETHSMFCEVDRGTESQKIWTKKTDLYLQMAATGEFSRLFNRNRFRVLVVVDTARRLLEVRKTIAQKTAKIFWFATLSDINRNGLFAAHWLRPVGDNRLSLL